MFTILKNFLITYVPHKDEKGQDLAEYALLIGLIALFLVGAVTYLGGGIDTTFRAIADTVSTWAVPAGP